MRTVERLENEEFRFALETKFKEYYVSNELRVISKNKATGDERELRQKYEISKTNYKRLFVRIDGLKMSVTRLAYKAFIDPNIGADDFIYCEDEMELQNLKKGRKQNTRKVAIDGIVYDSIRECSKDTGICYDSICKYLSGQRINRINVKYV